MKRARRIVLSLLTVLLFVCSFSISIAAEDNGVSMLSSEMLSKFKVVSTEIMTGTDKGFEETKTLTRAEVATIIIRLSGYLDGEAEGITLDDIDYGDVPADHWAKDYIALATKLGLVRGTGNGNFSPDDLVTIQEVETMVCRAIGAAEYIDAQGEWPQNYMDFSHEHGIDEYITKIGPDDSLRINTAVIIANVLDLLRGHVETKADGSKAWVFDQKSIAEDNLGVRLVVNKTCSSVKSGSFNGITVKEGVDLSIVKSGEKYDYYINDKNVIVGIWPSSLKEEAKKEQELIDKGIDPHTLLGDKDQQQEQKEEKTKKRSSGPAGPAVISMYSITKAPTITFDETNSETVFTSMEITGATVAPESTIVDSAQDEFEINYTLTDDTKYIFKGTDISLANLQARSNYSLLTNTDGVTYFVKLTNAQLLSAGEEPTSLKLTYKKFPNVISNTAIGSMVDLAENDDQLNYFLKRGVRVKSFDATNKIMVFETIGDGIYFDETEDPYIATLPLNDNEIVYAKVSDDKRELEVKWGTKVDISTGITKVVYSDKETATMPNIAAATRRGETGAIVDPKEYTDVQQYQTVIFSAPTGYTFKNVALTPQTFGGDENGVITENKTSTNSTYGLRVIVDYLKETDEFKVTVVSFGAALDLTTTGNVTQASLSDDKLTLPAMYASVTRTAKIGDDDFDETNAVHHGDVINVAFKPANPVANSFNGAAAVTKEMLTGNTDGKVTNDDSSVDAIIDSLTFDVANDTYNVAFKIVGKKIKPLSITAGNLGTAGDNVFTLPQIADFTAYIGDTQANATATLTGAGSDNAITVTYKPIKEYQVDDTAELAIADLGGDTDSLYKHATSTYNLKITDKKIDKDNNVITITFTPELKPFDITNGGSITPATLTADDKFTIAIISPASVEATWDPSGDNTQLSDPYTKDLTDTAKGKIIKAIYTLGTGFTFEGSDITEGNLLDGIDTLVNDNGHYAVKIDSFIKDGNQLKVEYKTYKLDDPDDDLYPDFEYGQWPTGSGSGNISYSRTPDTLVTFNHKNKGNISSYYISYFDGVGLENVAHEYCGDSGYVNSKLKVKYAKPIETPKDNSKATIDADNNLTPVAFDNAKVSIGGTEITSTYTITADDATNGTITLIYEAKDKSVTNGTAYYTFKDTNGNNYKVAGNADYFAKKYDGFTNNQVRGPLGADYYLEFASATVVTETSYTLANYQGKQLKVVYNVKCIVDINADTTDITNNQMTDNKFVGPDIAHATAPADKKTYTVTNDQLRLEIKYTPDWGYRFQNASVYQTYFEGLQDVYGDHKDWTMTFDSCSVDSEGKLVLVYKSGKYGTIPVNRITSTTVLTDANKNTVFSKLVSNGCQIDGTITPNEDEFTVTFKANDYFNFDETKGDSYKSLINIPNYDLTKVEVTRKQLVLTFTKISGGQD